MKRRFLAGVLTLMLISGCGKAPETVTVDTAQQEVIETTQQEAPETTQQETEDSSVAETETGIVEDQNTQIEDGKWSKNLPAFLFENNQMEAEEILLFLDSEDYSSENWLATFQMEPSTREASDKYFCYFISLEGRRETRIYANKTEDSISKIDIFCTADPLATYELGAMIEQGVYAENSDGSYSLNNRMLEEFLKNISYQDLGMAQLHCVDLENSSFTIRFYVAGENEWVDEQDNMAYVEAIYDLNTSDCIQFTASEIIFEKE